MKKNYFNNNYSSVISYGRLTISRGKAKDPVLLSELNLFIGLSYLKTENIISAERYVEKALELNPDCDIVNENFENEALSFFNTVKEKAVGSLEIKSIPSGADVFIDFSHRGKTPLVIKNIFKGKYHITMAKDKHELFTETHDINPNQINRIEKTLSENGFHSVLIKSTPPNATLFLNDIFKGKTPIFIDKLTPKRYNLKLSYSEGYKDYRSVLEIPVKDVMLYEINLEKRKDYFIYSMILPGLGQVMMKKYIHGIPSFGLFLGSLLYYRNYSNGEPDWIYKDISFVILQYRGYGVDIYKINGEEVDMETYLREYKKKTDEDAEINKWMAKRDRITFFGFAVYALNLLDTWYLLKTRDSTSERKMTFTKYKDYTGITWHIRF